MKSYFLALMAALMGCNSPAMAESTAISQHGSYSVAVVDPNTCAMGALGTSTGIMISYDGKEDSFVMTPLTSSTEIKNAVKYPVIITLDGKTSQWTAIGGDFGTMRGLIMVAVGSVDAYKALLAANVITFSLNGAEIVSLNGDADFRAALTDMVKCSVTLTAAHKA